jgi:predicted metal-dependent enzyme (double-stranded beta helix superfamily)
MAARLLEFVAAMTRLVNEGPRSEAQMLERAVPLMRALVAEDDWLPEAMTATHPQYYQQHLLYGDPLDRFSLVSFVWGPGQKTPVHDHTVWGVIGMLRGAECGQRYAPDAGGRLVAHGDEVTLRPGELDIVSPDLGDIHVVRNAFADRVSISIHLYGGNIGRIERHVYMPETSERKSFVSGYSNALTPNLWTREPA